MWALIGLLFGRTIRSTGWSEFIENGIKLGCTSVLHDYSDERYHYFVARNRRGDEVRYRSEIFFDRDPRTERSWIQVAVAAEYQMGITPRPEARVGYDLSKY